MVAAEEVGEGVGDEEELVGDVEGAVVVSDGGGKLADGVEGEELDAGEGVDGLLVDGVEELGHDVFGARVAVVAREAGEEALLVDEGVVDAPGVDGDGGDFDAFAEGGLESGLEFGEESEEVPEESAIDGDGAVFEAVEFLEGDVAVVDGSEDGSAGGGSEVEGEVVFHVWSWWFWGVLMGKVGSGR